MDSKQKIDILLNGGSAPQLSNDALESLNRIAFSETQQELSNRVREIAHPENPKVKDKILDGFLESSKDREHLD